MAKVLGVGGIFFKSPDPKALLAWYARWLGIEADDWGYAFRPATMPPGAITQWSPFDAKTEYFAPSTRDFMMNLVVDDLRGMLARVRESGAVIVGEPVDHDYGSFGWFVDPDGNKIELWQPKPPGPASP